MAGTGELLTFDDLGSTNLAVPNGYASLSWSNLAHLDAALFYAESNGYAAGNGLGAERGLQQRRQSRLADKRRALWLAVGVDDGGVE